MNKNQNTGKHSFCESKNHTPYNGFWKSFFAMRGVLNFDIFQYSIIYREKLQIIYANIRVWKLD